MRMNYKTYPTDYMWELKRAGKRKKSMAFLDYWDDLEAGDFHSIGFYAKAWNVSKSTAHGWINEFKEEIDKFLVHWQLRNERHYTYAKNRAERIERFEPNESNANEARNYGQVENRAERIERRVPNEEFNINDDDNIWRDKFFNDLFFLYRMNTKYAGKKEEAYKAYKKIKDKVDHNQLTRAILLYLHDPHIEKHYNLKNFIENEVFYSYMPKRIKVLVDGAWKAGTYDDQEELFIGDDGFRAKLTPQRLAELFSDGKLEFVR